MRGSSVFMIIIILFASGCLHPETPAKSDSISYTGPEESESISYAGSNVILLSIDALRADRLGLYNPRKDTSPNIDKLGGESIVFIDVLSAAGLTDPSHKSMLTGKYVPTHQNNLETTKSLAHILKEEGYVTAGFVDAFKVSRQFGFEKGFDFFDDKRDTEYDNRNKLESFSKWLDANKNKKFFVFIHLYDIHCPYTSPEPYYSKFTGHYKNNKLKQVLEHWCPRNLELTTPYQDQIIQNKKLISDLYDAQILTLDEMTFTVLIDLIKSAGVYNNTILLITSDHGEFLGEDDRFGHGPLDLPGLHIPLILHLPDGIGRRIDYPVSGVDIAPTVLDLLDVPVPYDMDGISLEKLVFRNEKPGREIRIANDPSGYNFFFQKGERTLIIYSRTGTVFIPESNTTINMRKVDKNIKDAGLLDFIHECYTIALGLKENIRPYTTTTLPLDEETKDELRSLGYVA